MDISVAGTDYDVFQYLVSHGISWISEETIMASNNLLVSSYLTSQEYGREVIKIEEMSPIRDDDPCFSGSTGDTKDIHMSSREEYIPCESEIYSTLFSSETPHAS